MTNSSPQQLREKIIELVGEATMQWKPTPEGVFDSDGAIVIAEKILAVVESERGAERGRIAEAVQRIDIFKQGDISVLDENEEQIKIDLIEEVLSIVSPTLESGGAKE